MAEHRTVTVAVYLTDSMTEIPALVIVSADEPATAPARQVWHRAGFSPGHVLLMDLIDSRVESDPFAWGNGTLWAAHWRLHTEPGFLDAVIEAGDGYRIECEQTRLAAAAQGREW